METPCNNKGSDIFNRYPASVFVGDVGTLGFGATFATAAIIGNIAFYAVIAILPMFFEMFATVYYTHRRQERLDACHNPVLLIPAMSKSPTPKPANPHLPTPPRNGCWGRFQLN